MTNRKKTNSLTDSKEELDVLKLSEDERIAYNNYQDDLHYQASMLESSYGLGKRQKAIEIAKNLIDVLDIEVIAKKTGLSIPEVEELANRGSQNLMNKQAHS